MERPIEFILRGNQDEDFNLHVSQWPEALRPDGMEWSQPAGFVKEHLHVVVDGHEIEFSPEPMGWQVSFPSSADLQWAQRVAEAFCRTMTRVSGQAGRVVPL